MVGGFVGAMLFLIPTAVLPVFQTKKTTTPVKPLPAGTPVTRLTVQQFQNSVVDLVDDGAPLVPGGPSGGLEGEYFHGRDRSEKNRVFDRVDPGVQFDFGTGAPDPGSLKANSAFDPHVFSIVWHGSVLAPDTGDYDFILRSDQSVRLFVNGYAAPLVDGAVRSANQTEFQGTIHLLGGHAYPIRLEFEKSTQGVDDGKATKRPSPHASVGLLWRPPRRTVAPIPAWCLYPAGMATSFVLTTPFPPDDRSMGFERGNSISKEWDEATAAAAIETANYVSGNVNRLAGTRDDAKDRKDRIEAYARRFVERAFGRPLPADVAKLYIDHQFEEAPGPEMAMKRVVLLALESPRYLYRDLAADQLASSRPTHDPYQAAADLSFALWDSLPDAQLRQAVEKGELSTSEQVARQAERMAGDPRTWDKLRAFLLEWLKVDDIPEIAKDRKTCGGFDGDTASDLRDSFELFLKNSAWSDASDYRDLMTSPTLYLDGRLAKLYGAKLAEDAPLQAVVESKAERCGVLTQPYLLARFGYVSGSDPIHRGVLVVRNLLGRVLNPPPAAFIPLPASAHPTLTTRERVALQTEPKFCQQCHSIINPLGFTMEKYDAIGRLRDTDAGKPVDTSGRYVARNGVAARFTGASDLAEYLANSDDAHRAFVQKLSLYMVKQPMMSPALLKSFAENRYSIRKLMAQIAVAATGIQGTKK